MHISNDVSSLILLYIPFSDIKSKWEDSVNQKDKSLLPYLLLDFLPISTRCCLQEWCCLQGGVYYLSHLEITSQMSQWAKFDGAMTIESRARFPCVRWHAYYMFNGWVVRPRRGGGVCFWRSPWAGILGRLEIFAWNLGHVNKTILGTFWHTEA